MPEYDFILGSLHNLRGERDFYYLKYESEEQCLALYDRYLEELIELAAIPCFDIMAHIGYCRRYMRRQGFDIEMDMERFGDRIDTLLRTLIENGRGIELNCSGLSGRRPRHLPLRAHPPPLPRAGRGHRHRGLGRPQPQERRRRRGGGQRAPARQRLPLRGELPPPQGGI